MNQTRAHPPAPLHRRASREPPWVPWVSNPRPTHDEKPGTLLRARYLHR
jgi:hypothetical protein